MKKLKIAVISPISWRTPPRKYGPWEQVANNIVDGLLARGHEVTLFATADSKTKAKLSAICPRPVEEDHTLDSEVYKFLHLANVFEHANEFDIIHNQFDYYALPFSFFINKPIITTINGFHNEQYKKIYKKYNKKTYYVSISNANRAKELSYTGTIYNGININDFYYDKNSQRNYLLFIGRISHDKGTDRAIKVAKKIKIPLIIAGQVPPEENNYFIKFVKPYIDGKFIKWLGPINPNQRNKIFSHAIASLHMINFDEPFGLTVVEAMASGVPVIAIDRGSMPEIISHKKDGFLIKNEDEAVKSLKMISNINRSICRQKVINKFSIEQMAFGYENIYRKILKI